MPTCRLAQFFRAQVNGQTAHKIVAIAYTGGRIAPRFCICLARQRMTSYSNGSVIKLLDRQVAEKMTQFIYFWNNPRGTHIIRLSLVQLIERGVYLLSL